MHKSESAWDWGVKDCTAKYIWDWKWLIKDTPLKSRTSPVPVGCKDEDGGRGSVHCELVMGLLGPCGTAGPGCAGAFCRSLLDTLCQGFVSFQLCLVQSYLGTLDLCCKMGAKGLSNSLCSSFSCAEGNNNAICYCPVWPGFPNAYRNYLLDKEF